MPSFAFKAIDLSGQDVTGVQDAPSRGDLVRELAAAGMCVTSVSEKAESSLAVAGRLGVGGRLHVRPKQLAVLTRQLATSLEAGLPLVTALEVMGEELDHAPSRELLRQLRNRVQEGASLSEAMSDHPRVFSIMYVRLVRVGETGGILDAVLAQLSEMLDRQIELRERVKTASVYPAIVLLLGIISVAVIITVIVPRIVESIGAQVGQLPWPTRVLMSAGDFAIAWWWLLVPAVAGAVLGFRQYVLRGPGRSWWDSLKLRMPIVGRLVRQLEAARLARSLGALIRGGVTITEALRVTRDTVQNVRFREAVDGLMESIHAGESIARPLQRTELFPPLLVQMVRVGESTGRLDEMLLRSAVVHEGEARVTLDRFVAVLPVAMILGLACVIGFIVAALVLAIMEFQTTGFGNLAR